VFADPHTPVVLAGLAVQSALVQQPLFGMHKLVPGQFLNPLLQVTPHWPVVALHTAAPFAGGTAQEKHAGPQAVGLVVDSQMPAQLCWPDGQTPLQALALGMHAPAHS